MDVSVIIPTFNRAHTLARALDSVLDQDLMPREILVADDGSTDDTPALIAAYQREHPDLIRAISLPHGGVSRARNAAAQRAKYPWLAFLDSDDAWLPERLSAQAPLTGDFPLIHGDEIWIRNGRRVNQKKIHQKSGGDLYIRSLKLCLISPSATLIRRDFFDELGGFREDFPVCEDYDLWLKATSRCQVGFVPSPIIRKYGGHSCQLSRRYVAMDHFRVEAMVDALSAAPLTKEKRKATLDEITTKAAILRAGYEKHARFEKLKELSGLLRQIRTCQN